MKKAFKIGKKWTGEGKPAFIIAEAGSNHDRKIEQAKQLIDIAKKSGVDAVKFQLFTAKGLYAKDHPAFKVVRENEFPRQWLGELVRYAKLKKIIFLATPFDKEAIDLLVHYDVPAFKWGSSETTNLELLRYAAFKKKPVLLATGMCDLSDIHQAVEVMTASGIDEAALLHCASVYPCSPSQANLRVMDTLKSAFDLPVGFSDHSLGVALPVVAAARGAKFIEKHFTLSRTLRGPDHSYALEPDELAQMTCLIREAEASLGSAVKILLPDEIKYGRRDGLYTARALSKGHKVLPKDICIKRPAVGIKSRYAKLAIGKILAKSLSKHTPISWADLKS